MLYNPKWNKELTVLGFVQWLKNQDPNTRYNYINPGDCAICRYMKAELGFSRPAISPVLGYGERGGLRKPYDLTLDQIVAPCQTYGEAQKRAEKLLGK